VGPFLHLALADPDDAHVVPLGTAGGFWVRGTVTDGDGLPVADAVVETWQAGPDGRFRAPDGSAHPDDPANPDDPAPVDLAAPPVPEGFRGSGRCPTDEHGSWALYTVRPGRVRAADGRLAAPHLAVSVFARGLLDRVVTRLYFADETEANATDPVLSALPEPDRAVTLLAVATADGYRFDIRLQGEGETVFFDL
jgi:protocatechuate 3,4-dioxygenase alpha subunit